VAFVAAALVAAEVGITAYDIDKATHGCGSALDLGLDAVGPLGAGVAPFGPKAWQALRRFNWAEETGSFDPSATSVFTKRRKAPGGDDAESLIIKERAPDGTTIQAVHQVGLPLPGVAS
jgi:hypothetical protein